MRGINRQTIFEDEEDCEQSFSKTPGAKEKSRYQVYAYCLMGNHLALMPND
jgi:predicted DNA-binding WGR domain protein